ncbi:pancreatic triacylglycerol lipase-like [Lycorma delicatula]|uniref:pancreatic triacylglycerol lipase-like n=1 Tax=Lycorma delicatula TaxID=130591 RepID=UPI003F5147CB
MLHAQATSTPATSFSEAKDVIPELAPALDSMVERIVNIKLGNRPTRQGSPKRAKKSAAIRVKSSSNLRNESLTSPSRRIVIQNRHEARSQISNPFTVTLLPYGNCLLCCPVKEKSNIAFHLYTRRNPDRFYRLYLNDVRRLRSSPYAVNRTTIIYVHGFTEMDGGPSATAMRRAYLRRGDYNVIVVDWSPLAAAPWYETAVEHTHRTGRYLAKFLEFLCSQGINLGTIHLIGFSLGAEIAGFTGKNMVTGKLPRITGLDPAFPLYMFSGRRGHLSSTDAKFVDVIHTDGGVFGFPVPIGHADFFPNGGYPIQPGCRVAELFRNRELRYIIACSHNRAWMYYTESVNRPFAFESTPCRDYDHYLENRCPGEPILGVSYDVPQPEMAYMGFTANKNLRGKFYLTTNSTAPYGVS